MEHSRISLDESFEEPVREKETELENKPIEFLLACLSLHWTGVSEDRFGTCCRGISLRWRQHDQRLLFKGRESCFILLILWNACDVDGIINKAQYAALAEVYTMASDSVWILNRG